MPNTRRVKAQPYDVPMKTIIIVKEGTISLQYEYKGSLTWSSPTGPGTQSVM